MKRTKRILSLLLSLCLVLGLFPSTAFAASSNLPFTDVNTSDWYYDAVQYAYEKGMMNGTSTTTFSPNDTTTRGMIVTILHRMEGTPAAVGTNFTDVPTGQWYSDAVSWASANGIVGGYGGGMFGPSDPITREQMAAILSRYSQHKGYDTGSSGSIAGFSDASQVSSYAVDPMGWAIGNGLISGVGNNTLAPKGNATRAQVATILMRFCENVAGKGNDTPETPETPASKTYTVTFDLNYGSDTRYDVKTVKEGETVGKPSNPSRSGYSFGGWYAEKSGGKQFDFKTGITSDLTLYAHWSSNSSSSGGGGGSNWPTVYYYTVTFDVLANDVTNAPAVQQIRSGSSATEPSIPSRNGYNFAGWYADNTYTSRYDFSLPVRANLTLYAKWERQTPVIPVDPDATFQVTFILNDGSDGIYEIQTVNANGTVQEPSVPVRDQYRFTGWYTEAETAAEYNFDTPVTGDFILYAGWGNPDGSDEGIYSVSSGGGTEASISGIERSSGQVHVTINTPKPATLVVEFLDETEFWDALEGTESDIVAIQGIATQTPNYCEMEPVSIPMGDVSDLLPQYYVLRAHLYDQNGNELCDPYYSIQYTSIYKEFDALTIQDRVDEYGEDRVIVFDAEESSQNYGVFAEDVKIIETSNSVNILTVAYEFTDDSMFPTTTYTFANPSADVSELQVGDKIYALDQDGYPQLFKIGAIPPTGGDSVVITPDENVILSDFYAVLKVDMDGTEADVQVQDGIQTQLEIIDVDQTFSKAINYSINWKPLKEVNNGTTTGDWLTFTGSVGGKAELSIKLAWDAHLFQKDYFEASATLKVEASLKGSVKAEGGPSWDVTDKVNAEWKAGKVSVPTNVPGLTLFLETSVPVELKFSGTATISATATLQGGFSFNTTSGFHPIGKAELKSEVNFTAQAELKAGPKVAVGVAFLEKVVKADASVQAGIKATVSGSVGAQATTGDSKHDCFLCLKGDIKWFKNAKTSISYDITKKVSAKYEKTIYESETALGIGKVYLSLMHDGAESVFVDKNGNPKTGPVFGWGECPNKAWRTIFEAKDSGGNDLAIALDVNRQDGRVSKNGTTSFNEFLNNGVYTASGVIDGLTVRKSFTVNGSKQTVVLTPTSTDRSLSGIITDADTSDVIEKADVVAKQDDMIVASTKSAADGRYTLNLPEGSYVLEVSKTDYVTNTVHVTILNDREVYQNVELTRGETGKGGFSGRIVDASTGAPIEGVQLKVRSGWNASSDGRVVWDMTTNANGEYEYVKPTLFGQVVGLPAGGYTVTASKEGYDTRSFNVTILPNVQNNPQPEQPLSRHIQIESGSYRIVLTWGPHPRDLDSHVVGQLNGGGSFHVYFSHKNQADGGNTICNLDRDDTRGNGTETIILTPTNNQPYYYYIYKYAGESDIAHSSAHIDIYDSNGLIDSFNAPTDQGSGRYWNVFAIVDGQLIIQNMIADSANISYAGASSASALWSDELEQSNLATEDNSPKNIIDYSENGEASDETEETNRPDTPNEDNGSAALVEITNPDTSDVDVGKEEEDFSMISVD